MADFGEIFNDNRIAAYSEDNATQLSKDSGPGGTDAVIGTNATPVVLLTSSAQILSGRVVAPADWDTSVDTLGVAGVATNGAVLNGDQLDMDFSYTYIEAGTAALADMNKAATTNTASVTFTTAEGLLDETLYLIVATLDRNDATNPYAGAGLGGGFTFQLRINALSAVTSIYVVSIGGLFPLAGLNLGPVPAT